MTFDPILADMRFGCGLGPGLPSPDSPQAIVDGLTLKDDMAVKFPIETTGQFWERMRERSKFGKIKNQNQGTPKAKAAQKAIRRLNVEARKDHLKWMGAHILRRAYSTTPFRERIESFWADHFTATGKDGLTKRATSPYVESAIRPRLTGHFEDLLIAAVTHPVMVHYLDQNRSAGPNSIAARKGSKAQGLNENLAREVLELHTLGVNGPDTQRDVRQLAELLTGLTMNALKGQHFRKNLAEPGAETVLGVTYGGPEAHISDIHAVLRDLARHPATARHIAGKLAVHFVSDQPDPGLVRAVEQVWLDTKGDLKAVYHALISHPAAWRRDRPNVKLPFDFVSSAARALAVPPKALLNRKEGEYLSRIHHPLKLMGHVWQRPTGPDGLNESDSVWITPQGMAARLQWAMAIPRLLVSDLPDPRVFVDTALGPNAPQAVRFAAQAAETRSDGVGLVLASPAFQRM